MRMLTSESYTFSAAEDLQHPSVPNWHGYDTLEGYSQRRPEQKDDCVPPSFEPDKQDKPFQLFSLGLCVRLVLMAFGVSTLMRKTVTLQKSASSVQMKSQCCLQALGLDELGDFGRVFQVGGIFQNTHVACSLQVVPLSTNTNRGRKKKEVKDKYTPGGCYD